MSKILFINPPWRENIYLTTNVKVGAPSYPNLTLATLAGHLTNNHQVKIIDLDLIDNYRQILLDLIKSFNPDLIAISAKTPEYPAALKIIKFIKNAYPAISTIIGGVHATSCYSDLAKENCFNIISIGEGDYVIPDILSAKSLSEIKGIIYKDSLSQKTNYNQSRPLIDNLDLLPYPAWHLFDLKKYKNSRLSSRKNPVGHIETSRGCSYNCNFCNKLTFGTVYRTKSPARVVNEMEYMLSCGFKEIHIADDSFTQNIERAKKICLEIIKRKLKFPWSLINGIRVDKVDEEFFKLAKRAGCWQTGFGIETGDQQILDTINKKTTLEQVEKAVRLANKAGINTFGFFVFGLLGETKTSLQKTIDFAKKLPLTIAKFDICIPYPGTSYFKCLESQNLIISKDWSKYNVHEIDEPVYQHPQLSWPIIGSYYKKAFKEFYFRPGYILKRFIRGLKTGDLFYDIKYLFMSKW